MKTSSTSVFKDNTKTLLLLLRSALPGARAEFTTRLQRNRYTPLQSLKLKAYDVSGQRFEHSQF